MIARLNTSLSWINRDARLITAARGTRTFSQSFVSVIIALYLAELGFKLWQIGAVLTVGVAGVSFFAFVVGLISGKVGRRRLLVIFSLLAASSGVAMYFAETFIPLLVIAFLGSLATGGGGGGESPAQPLEIAILPDTASPERRTDIFAIYSIVARTGTFLGALAAGLPAVLFQDALGLSVLSSFKVMFLGFAICQLAGAALYAFISPGVEAATTQQQWQNPLKLPSRGRIFTLTGLYSVDTFTTSMLIQGLMAYWFSTKFGLALESLALVFALSHLLTASSLWIAAKQNRTAEYDGIHPYPVQPLPAGRSLCTLGHTGDSVLAMPRLSRPNGRSNQGLVHHGGDQSGRTGGHGQPKHGEPKRGGDHWPHGDHGYLEHHRCVDTPRRLGLLEDRVRYFSLFHVPERPAAGGRGASPEAPPSSGGLGP